MNKQNLLKACFAEFFGTFILVLVTILTISLTPIYHAFLVGFILLGLIYIFAVSSGAYFNPAVTMAVYLDHQINKKSLILFTICQILGGTLAALLAALLIGSSGISSQGILTNSRPELAFLVEFIITFILTLFVLILTSGGQKSIWTPIIVVSILIFLVINSYDLSGSSLNPARSIGAAIIENKLNTLWIYLFGPILGALAAFLVFNRAKRT